MVRAPIRSRRSTIRPVWPHLVVGEWRHGWLAAVDRRRFSTLDVIAADNPLKYFSDTEPECLANCGRIATFF